MIVSFRHRFIFVAVPKTAGHAIRAGLRDLKGPKDWEQCSLFEPRSFPNRELAKIGHGHISARQIAEYLPKGTFQGFFSFAFVRNPYDRFVSFCAFIHRDSDLMARDPIKTMKATLQNERFHHEILMRPQHEFVCDKNGEVMVDHLGRFEDIQSEFDAIRTKFKAVTLSLPTINASLRSNFQECYDSELQEGVHRFYERDFQLLGYNRAL